MKHNIKLIVAYDGTRYLGWQKTKEGPSIEEYLEKVLSQILQETISLQAASRTDAGVHAEGQVVNFFTSQDLDFKQLLKSVNSLLPSDISVVEMSKRPLTFHPTLDCKGKEYHYFVCNKIFQLPFQRHFSWHFPYPLNFSLMEKACSFFVGVHDFSSFCNERSLLKRDAIREIYHCGIEILPEERLQFVLKGNHFLYKMVRNIVGTLIYVGCGKISLESIPHILLSKDRAQAGVSAPAHGLVLKKVFYTETPHSLVN